MGWTMSGSNGNGDGNDATEPQRAQSGSNGHNHGGAEARRCPRNGRQRRTAGNGLQRLR
jgi:hypothetical protein